MKTAADAVAPHHGYGEPSRCQDRPIHSVALAKITVVRCGGWIPQPEAGIPRVGQDVDRFLVRRVVRWDCLGHLRHLRDLACSGVAMECNPVLVQLVGAVPKRRATSGVEREHGRGSRHGLPATARERHRSETAVASTLGADFPVAAAARRRRSGGRVVVARPSSVRGCAEPARADWAVLQDERVRLAGVELRLLEPGGSLRCY